MNEDLVTDDTLWLGSELSQQFALQAQRRVQTQQGLPAMAAGYVTSSEDDDEEDDLPYMLSIQGDVGVVTIRGPLVNSDSPWNRYYGISSYSDIRAALVCAAQHEGVKGILLDIHSGGGAVSGVSDTAELIRQIHSGIKPVWAVTDGTMASAAYWLGCSAGQVYGSNVSIVGSIGVIAVLTEYSKALKEAGVGVKVLRVGKYKALVNSVEPLGDEGEKQLMRVMSGTYDIFIGHVANMRGRTVENAEAQMGQGREFMGAEAVSAGLIDGVASFDRVYASFQTKLLDTASAGQNNSRVIYQGQSMTRKALTSTAVAAAAAGVVLPETTSAASPTAASEAQDPAPNATTVTTTAPATETTSAASTAPAQSELVSLLQSQLAAAQDKVLSLTAENTTLKGSLEPTKAHVAALREIAAKSLSTMKVALGNPAIDASTMSVDALLADHASTSAAFHSAFKVGGVAATSTEDTGPRSAPATPSPFRQAQVNATRVGA